MHLRATPVHRGRKRDLAGGLAVTGPQRPHGAKPWTQVDTLVRLGAVEGGDVLRRETGGQSLRVDPGAFGRSRVGPHPAVGMERPAFLARCPAEDLEVMSRGASGVLQEELEVPRRLRRGVLPIPVGENKRAAQLQVLNDNRLVTFGPASRGRHGGEERARRQHAAEHPVVVQPRRIRDRDLAGEQRLAARRLVPGPQQGVVAGGAAAARAGHPVAAMLEGVAGQGNATTGLTGEQAFEGHRCPGLVEACDGLDEAAANSGVSRLPAGGSLEARQRERLGGRTLRPAHLHHRAQHGVRADLHHHLDALIGQGLDRAPEGHRRPRLPAPVGTVERRARIVQAARHAADQPARGHRCGEGGRGRLDVVQCWRHQGAVVGGTRRQHGGPEPVVPEAVHEGADRGGGTADDLLGAVVGGDADARFAGRRVLLGHRGLDAFGGRVHRAHRPVRPQRAHEFAARRREAKPVAEREHARGLRRGDLAEAVPQDNVGSDPQARPQRRERALERVDRRLCPGGIVQISHCRAPEHDVQQRDTAPLLHLPVAAVKDRAHHRLAAIQRLAHPDPLAGLAGVDECQLAPRAGGRLPGWVVIDPRRRQRLEGRSQRSHVAEGHAGPAREVAAADARRPGHVGQQFGVARLLRLRGFGVIVQPRHIAPGEIPERLGAPGRQGQEALGSCGAAVRRHRIADTVQFRRRDRARRAGWPAGPVRTGEDPVALDHHVGVRSRPAEPADSRQRRTTTVTWPRRRLGSHLHRQPLPVDFRRGGLEVEMPRDHPPVHRQRHLDDAGDPRSRFQMAHVRLDRADQQRPIRRTTDPEGVRHGPQLDGVPDRCAGAVGLQVVNLCRRYSRPAKRLGDDEFLRLPVRHGEPRAGPVLVQRRTPDHPPDPVSVGFRLVQPLEDEDPAALAPDVAVGGRVERGATAVGRQHPGDGAQLEQSPREDGMHPSCQRQVRLTALQTDHRLMHRHERGRAGRVQGDRRSLQAERVGDPPDGRVERRAGDRIEAGGGLGGLDGLGDEPPVLVVADAGVDAGARARQPIRIDSGVLQGTPARLQH